MSAITLVFAALSAVLTFVIAAVVIGREAHRLDSVAPRAVYDPDEATKFVADHLPAGTQSRLTYDELQKLLVLHMRWKHEKGLQPSDVIDRKQGIDSTLVVGEETLTAYLLGKAEESNIDVLDDVDVVHVVRAHLDYFEAIGAVGPSASTNDLCPSTFCFHTEM